MLSSLLNFWVLPLYFLDIRVRYQQNAICLLSILWLFSLPPGWRANSPLKTLVFWFSIRRLSSLIIFHSPLTYGPGGGGAASLPFSLLLYSIYFSFSRKPVFMSIIRWHQPPSFTVIYPLVGHPFSFSNNFTSNTILVLTLSKLNLHTDDHISTLCSLNF